MSHQKNEYETEPEGYRSLDALFEKLDGENSNQTSSRAEVFVSLMKNGIRIENVHQGTSTDPDRDTVLHFRMKGKSCVEIAELTGMPIEAVEDYSRMLGFPDGEGILRLTAEDETWFSGAQKSTAPGRCCPQCGKEVIRPPKGGRKKFCSDECRHRWKNEHQKAGVEITCAHCGRVFTVAKGRNVRYCCHECYIAERYGREEVAL